MAALVVRHPWKALSFVLLTVSLITLSLLRGWETSAVAGGGGQTQPTVRVTAPLWMQSGRFESVLILNNSRQEELNLSILLFDSEGVNLSETFLPLAPRQTRVASLAELFEERLKTGQGSLQILYSGHDYDLGAQLEISDRALGTTTDIPCFFNRDFAASSLSGLFWNPAAALDPAAHPSGDVELYLVNAAEQERTVTVRTENGSGAVFEESRRVAPHAALTFSQRDLAPTRGSAAGGDSALRLRIDFEGEAGDVVGGSLWRSARGVSGFEPLEDLGLRKDPELSLSTLLGAESKQTRLPLLLSNSGSAELGVSLTVSLKSREQEPMRAVETEVVLRGGESRLLDLSDSFSATELLWASLDLKWDGAADALQASSWSLLEEGRSAVPNALVNPRGQTSMAFNYPWLLDPEGEARIFIKNPTEEKQAVNAYLYTADGQQYDFGTPIIEPHEVLVIDLGKIRREQIPDPSGRVLTETATLGQLFWFPLSEPKVLLGRAVVSGPTQTVSLSCAICSYPTLQSILLLPNEGIAGGPGASEQILVEGTFVDCHSGHVTNQSLIDPSLMDYQSQNTSIATVNSSGLVTFQAGGQTGVIVSSPFQREFCDILCTVTGTQTVGPEICPVWVYPSVTIEPFAGVPKNGTLDVQVTLNPSPSSHSLTLQLVTTTGTGLARFDSNNSNTMSISSSGMITIKGVTESSTADNIELRVKGNSGATLATEKFSVVWVTLEFRHGEMNGLLKKVSSDNKAIDEFTIFSNPDQTLGTFLDPTQNEWVNAVEIVGTVMPTNYTGLIMLNRSKKAVAFNGINQCVHEDSGPDPSEDEYRDDDPQSGDSVGTVYDLDLPGNGLTGAAPVGTIDRFRANLTQWAELDGKKVSNDLLWFARTSIRKDETGAVVLETSISGDNKAGPGQQNLTWNLQDGPGCPNVN